MALHLSKRGFIRIITFSVAAIAVLGVRDYQLMQKHGQATQTISANYMKSVEDLASSADKINTTLQKQLYCGTPELQQKLANTLRSDAADAKNALSQLPISELNLGNTYKFLSQVGNYSLSLSEKAASGEELTDEEYENLKSLYEFSEKLCDDMWDLENKISSGTIDLTALQADTEAATDEDVPTVDDGFTDFEEGFDDYPSLIYDGPFSDNILEKDPEMLKGKDEVSQETAAATAAKALNLNPEDLTAAAGEEGKMPSYTFSADGVYAAVTKPGGYLSYFIKHKASASTVITVNQALKYADEYLASLGIENLSSTYHETYNNVCTVNYAAVQDDVILYTDLIKVSVSMETGEILGFDCRGYLVNHKDRTLEEPKVTKENAQANLSPMLNLKSTRLVMIPSDGQSELLCYEFTCTAEDNRHILVYFNALTGKEERILILIESAYGVLTV